MPYWAFFCHSIGRNEGEVQSLAGTSGFSEQFPAIDDMLQIGRSNLEGFPPEYEDTKIMLLFEFRKRYYIKICLKWGGNCLKIELPPYFKHILFYLTVAELR